MASKKIQGFEISGKIWDKWDAKIKINKKIEEKLENDIVKESD